MNISPTAYRELVHDVATLKTQVATLLQLLSGQRATQRDSSITGFCKRHGISRGTYWNMQQEGKGPRVISVGKQRRVITEEAEADWIHERQAAAEADAAARQRKG